MSVESIRTSTESYLQSVKNDPFNEFNLRTSIYRNIIKDQEEVMGLKIALIILTAPAANSINCTIKFHFLDKSQDQVDISVS